MRLGSGRRLLRVWPCVGALAFLSGTGAFAPARDAAPRTALEVLRVPPRPHERRVAEQWRAHRKQWPEFLSDTRRNARLGADGILTSRRARAARAAKIAARGEGAAPDTLDLLIVRVGFSANRNPDLTSMDASGDFALAPDSTVVVNPPPHGVPYFDAQLVGVRDYYRIQ